MGLALLTSEDNIEATIDTLNSTSLETSFQSVMGSLLETSMINSSGKHPGDKDAM